METGASVTIDNLEFASTLKTYLSQFGEMTDSDMAQMVELMNVKVYPKNSYLVREGQMANKCYFVLKGIVRQYYNIDGEEKTTNFYMDGEPVSSTFPTDIAPSQFCLICNEDTMVCEANPGDDKKLLATMPQLQTINEKATETENMKVHESLLDFKLLSAEERYLKLLRDKPQLIDRVPLYQLASYLGIKAESLSRIRKRISRNGMKNVK
jgi:CRP-like cAMP-binding protein